MDIGRLVHDSDITFIDRHDAGRRLATRLTEYRDDAIVIALPRGGVPVGYEIALALDAELDVCVVRKLGVPGHEELAMGAIAGGTRVLNAEVIVALRITPDEIDRVATREQRELERRVREYRDDRPPPDLTGRTAIVVDDGLATGSTMKAAVQALRQSAPRTIVIAVPVAPAVVRDELRDVADAVVTLVASERFGAVGLWYGDFSPTSDAEVRTLLDQARRRLPRDAP